MSLHKRQMKKYKQETKGLVTSLYFEAFTGLQNLIIGMYYIYYVGPTEVFEALVYGFVIIEIPKLVLAMVI